MRRFRSLRNWQHTARQHGCRMKCVLTKRKTHRCWQARSNGRIVGYFNGSMVGNAGDGLLDMKRI